MGWITMGRERLAAQHRRTAHGVGRGLASVAMVVAIGSLSLPAAAVAVPSAPTVISNPEMVIVAKVGDSATFTTSGTGNPAPRVTWQEATTRNGPWTAVPGALTTTLTMTATDTNHGHLFRAVFSNVVGSAASKGARLV